MAATAPVEDGNAMTDRDDELALARVLAGFVPSPPTIITPEQGRRWQLCVDIATTAGEFYENGNPADPMFVAFAARGLYDSDLPTDDPADAPTAGGCGVPGEALPIDYPGAGTVIDNSDVKKTSFRLRRLMRSSGCSHPGQR